MRTSPHAGISADDRCCARSVPAPLLSPPSPGSVRQPRRSPSRDRPIPVATATTGQATRTGARRRSTLRLGAAAVQDELTYRVQSSCRVVGDDAVAAVGERFELNEVRGQRGGDRFAEGERHNRVAVTGDNQDRACDVRQAGAEIETSLLIRLSANGACQYASATCRALVPPMSSNAAKMVGKSTCAAVLARINLAGWSGWRVA